MHSKYNFILFLIFFLSGVIAYGQKLYTPTAEDSKRTGVSKDTLVFGRKLYVNNCGSCHPLISPGQFTKESWVKVLPEMQKKAKCSDQQMFYILGYLTARSKQD